MVIFKGGLCRVSPGFHIFVSDFNQRRIKIWVQDGCKIFWRGHREGKTLHISYRSS